MYGDRRHQVKMPGGLLFFDDKKVIIKILISVLKYCTILLIG